MRILFLVSVAVIATCGLIYELIAGTLASYLLGDSITQFSTIIGVYLFSMGIGSYFSKFVQKRILETFIVVEILVGLLGGFSSTLLYSLFNHLESFQFFIYALIGTIGILVGLEIPLMMRILKDEFDFKDLVSHIFSFDYAGALLASLAFPLFFVPQMGLIKTSLFFGILNVLIALLLIFNRKVKIQRTRTFQLIGTTSFIVLLVAFVLGDKILRYTEDMAYDEKVIYSKSTPYQRITLTSDKNGTKLFLNGNLQFYSADEYRYHEALVHPVMSLVANPKKVLILGGGDGFAVRELIKYKTIESIQLVDLDPEMTRLFKRNPQLSALNDSALFHPKLRITNQDAFIWLKTNKHVYDVILIDLPDPSNFSLGKLYTDQFYKAVGEHLTKNGALVVQSTSPFVAPKSYWCIANTLQITGLKILPYHTFIPSFGDWGYLLASKQATRQPDFSKMPSNLRFFSPDAFESMCYFPKDVAYRTTEINRLNNQALVHYFETEWNQFQ
ncbi:MAG: polyamine aminopropyltransferase [Crocinitomicaceae bacterium]|nr:MAG: polyamine aminopropyltransferase [Crocinitomicaceae bacterium]